ncbi:competence protein CoiA family protein [uncultured Legionella sp.]|uniref:competence protein CoiA family protein n=1 Tax=uncultured Legionella sp. TaxID=210934 RepID=UPI00263073DF|nr:competence protein CoiA family protein [uncultured Legionella sp.]
MKSLKIKLPFGLNENNVIVHIANVESGKSCNCICPSCSTPLIAAKGTKNQHHFKHATTIECEEGLESAIHMAAKQIIKERKQIKLPEYTINKNILDSKGKMHFESKTLVARGRSISFDSVQEEQELNQMRADILAITNNQKLMIEVFYRHKVDEQKIEKIKAANISTIEIDLSDLTPNDVRNWETFWLCINDPNRAQWLYNARASSESKELEKQLSLRVQKIEKEYQQEQIKRLKQEQEAKPLLEKAIEELKIIRSKKYGEQLEQEDEKHPAWSFYIKYLQHSSGELPDYLSVDVSDGDWIFGCNKVLWQTAFYYNFIILNKNNRNYFSIKEIGEWLQNTAKCKIPSCAQTIGKYGRRFPELLPTDISINIPSSWKTLREYFNHLGKIGILIYSGSDRRNRGSCWFQILGRDFNSYSPFPSSLIEKFSVAHGYQV